MSEIKFIDKSAAEVLEEIITGLENGVAEPLYPGDERRIFGEALALSVTSMYATVNDAARQKFLRYARGEVLDALAENYDISRIGPVPATCSVRFALNSAVGTDVAIPAGTRVTGDFERYFAVDEAAVIEAGETEVTVSVTATEGGTAYNDIPAGGINVLVDLLPYIDVVANTTATAGGADGESDDALRERIRAAADRNTTAGSAASYRYWAMQADPRIIDAKVTTTFGVQSHVSAEMDVLKTVKTGDPHHYLYLPGDTVISTLVVSKTDGTEGVLGEDYTVGDFGGLVRVTILSEEGGSLYDEETLDVDYYRESGTVVTIVPVLENGEQPDQALIDKVTAAVNADDVRPMTDVVVVSLPGEEEFDVNIDYYVTAANEAAAVAAIEGEGGAIDQYIEWQRGAIGRDINPDKLRQFVLNAGADRVTVVKPEYTSVDDTWVAAFSGVRIVTHTVEG